MSELQLHDTDKLQLHGDAGNWQTVGEMRRLGYTEEELAVAAEWGAIERGGECYTIRELQSGAGIEQLRASVDQLRLRARTAPPRQRVHGYHLDERQPRHRHLRDAHPAGQTASKPFTFTGDVLTTPTFAKPVNAGGPLKGEESKLTPSPDPYAKELAAMRAASATPESFEDSWKTTQRRTRRRTHPAQRTRRRAPDGDVASGGGQTELSSAGPLQGRHRTPKAANARALAAKENR